MDTGRVNRTAPELRVPVWLDEEGQKRPPLELAELGERYKAIYCFQHWCPGCHSHGFPALKSMIDALASEDFGIAVVQTVFEGGETNTFDRLRENQIKYNLKVPFGHDVASAPHGSPSLMEDYRTGGTPWFIIIDPENQVVFSDFHMNLDKLLEIQKTPIEIG